jgi:hypothetical protein
LEDAAVTVDQSRRAVLAASAAALPLLLTACRGVQALGAPPPPALDIRLLRSAISAEELMVARYTAAIKQAGSRAESAGSTSAPAVSASITAALTAVLAEHSQHLDQLTSRLIEPAPTKPSPRPAVSLPAGQTDVLNGLETAEQAASDRLIGQIAWLPPSLAQLFASIAASEATHVPYLQAARLGR